MSGMGDLKMRSHAPYGVVGDGVAARREGHPSRDARERRDGDEETQERVGPADNVGDGEKRGLTMRLSMRLTTSSQRSLSVWSMRERSRPSSLAVRMVLPIFWRA